MKIVLAKKRKGRTVFVEHDPVDLRRQIQDMLVRGGVAEKLQHVADYVEEQGANLTGEELETLEGIRGALIELAERAIEWRDKIEAALARNAEPVNGGNDARPV
jgi:hypothetical protein